VGAAAPPRRRAAPCAPPPVRRAAVRRAAVPPGRRAPRRRRAAALPRRRQMRWLGLTRGWLALWRVRAPGCLLRLGRAGGEAGAVGRVRFGTGNSRRTNLGHETHLRCGFWDRDFAPHESRPRNAPSPPYPAAVKGTAARRATFEGVNDPERPARPSPPFKPPPAIVAFAAPRAARAYRGLRRTAHRRRAPRHPACRPAPGVVRIPRG
jgi:hypothetical protein